MEAGCGVGRLLRYFKERKHDIVGIDFIDIAISKLKQADNGLNVEVGDITNLRFRDKSFSLYWHLGYTIAWKKISKLRCEKHTEF